MARKSTGKKLRFEVLKRDRFECQYCGAHPPQSILVVDHITPVSKGGVNDIDNLITACETCNQGKAARELTSIPESLSTKAARIAEAEEQLLGYQEILQAKRERIEQECWRVAAALWPKCDSVLTSDFVSIKRFVGELGLYQCLEFAEAAYARSYTEKSRFKYFCGCCWKQIKGIPYAAR